ncbi:MAG: hypothetical protein ACRC0E_09940 [Soonwooa sp.]
MALHPYYIYYQKPGAEASQDEEGNFVDASAPQWLFYSKGRDSVNSKGQIKQLSDGSSYVFNAIIYATKNSPILQEGTPILVTKEEVKDLSIIDENFIEEGKKTGLIRVYKPSVGFSLSQLNTRIWI